MQTKDNSALTDLYLLLLEKKGISKDKNFVLKVVASIKERAVFVEDFWELSNFFFVAPTAFDEKASKKNWKAETGSIMLEVANILKNVETFSAENTEREVKKWITTKEISFGKVMQPLRLSLVGKLAGPHLFNIIEIIGKKETIQRIENAILIL
jgi:glutamyl-tRNA synthetase